MFRLHKQKSDKSGERFDFKFSSFQALQVPKGWDKLLVSIVSVDTGKTVNKSGKASVRNGNCRWTESFSQSTWIARGDTSKVIDECLFKLVVAMGSSRSVFLGEATINLASYISSKSSVPLSLPLKKCNHGTVLQVKIQCLTPREKRRDEQWKDTDLSYSEDASLEYDDLETKSDASDCTFTRSVGSSSSYHLEGTLHPGEFSSRVWSLDIIPSREPSLSASDSRNSFDSLDGSYRENFSPLNGVMSNLIGRQDSTGSQTSSPRGSYSYNDSLRTNHSSGAPKAFGSGSHSHNHREDMNRASRLVPSSPLRNAGSSKDLLEAAEITIGELRAEARMWEQNARKLMIDLENSQKEFFDLSNLQKSLEAALSTSRAECDCLKLEIKQELEETVEKQKVEIDSLSAAKSECEELRKHDFGERDIVEQQRQDLHVENRNLEVQFQQLQESHRKLENTIQVMEETLEEKNHEMEIEQASRSRSLMNCEAEWKGKLAEKEQKIINLEMKLSEALDVQGLKETGSEKEGDSDLTKEIEDLKLRVQELERDCNELTDENLELHFNLKESRKDHSSTSNSPLSDHPGIHRHEQKIKIVTLQQQLQRYQQKEIESKDHPAFTFEESNISESPEAIEISTLLAQLHEQIQLSLAELKQQHVLSSHANPEETISDDSNILKGKDLISQKQQVEIILNNFFRLKQIFRESSTGVGGYGKESSDLVNELSEKISEIEKLKSDNLLKDNELEAVRNRQKELEAQISSVQKEKNQLEENIGAMLREAAVTAKRLEDLHSEMIVLNYNMDSQISTNQVLVKKSAELENGKEELEVHLFELEKENLQLSERISGLEAQLRYLTEERECHCLELQNSESQRMKLKEEIKRLENEMEAQKVDMRQKIEEMQTRWLEVQEECQYLKVANPKLQATTENLNEECSMLHKANEELRKQKAELNEHCSILEAELNESEKVFSNMASEVEALEEKYSSMLEEIASKEKALNFEIEALLQENKKQKDKLVLEDSLLNQMYLEKTMEVDNLQREVCHLTEQISATQDEKEKTASEAVLEVSHLRADKAMLEASLQDLQGKFKLSESKLNALQVESETETQGLKEELAAAKQNQEILMADHEKILDLLEEVKSNEDKLKGTVRGLELKLKASEYENQQLLEEISSLKIQLQKTALLQDEILVLKETNSEAKFENERLQSSFQMLSRDHEELTVEKTVLVQKVSDSQQAVSELDALKCRKVSLEEKVLRLQGDLTAREALGTQEAALKNELAQIRRENSQLQRKIKYLEEEKEECLKKAQGLEEELKQIKQDESTSKNNTVEENNNQLSSEKLSTETDQPAQQYVDENHTQVDNNQNCNNETPQVSGVDLSSKNQKLENELAEALEANGMYKAQLKSLLSKEASFKPTAASEKSMGEGATRKDGCDCQTSAFETELKELRERYLHMSLKYAEVEDQREQLVMQLKAASGRKRWF
ncbi:hypothetical protein V6N11_070472 [Hibiscus sabdariffa]|uniref:C2 NT-type domain-containing protein n=1 Tax=Hibiscus sabdariffa TaxID=183260 RepID=A0ABR2QF49_9ROSI